MLVDPEVSPCAGSLAESADTDVAGTLAEEPANGRLQFDVSSSCDSVWQDPAMRHMCAHPEYLAVFARTQNFIMRGDGPLPFDIRHYIAIMDWFSAAGFTGPKVARVVGGLVGRAGLADLPMETGLSERHRTLHALTGRARHRKGWTEPLQTALPPPVLPPPTM
ncbi:Sestrin-3 [Amphibalanus amphitrite]|uniref:Sestrin-3 n=1 Tax=Amphibalanus amphitrite TaxID=1232801 RepID=A0A6A4VCZ7_AMPAM|nr:Sestrin-3 [Amphibalanus amphitrite]